MPEIVHLYLVHIHSRLLAAICGIGYSHGFKGLVSGLIYYLVVLFFHLVDSILIHGAGLNHCLDRRSGINISLRLSILVFCLESSDVDSRHFAYLLYGHGTDLSCHGSRSWILLHRLNKYFFILLYLHVSQLICENHRCKQFLVQLIQFFFRKILSLVDDLSIFLSVSFLVGLLPGGLLAIVHEYLSHLILVILDFFRKDVFYTLVLNARINNI